MMFVELGSTNTMMNLKKERGLLSGDIEYYPLRHNIPG